MTIATTMIANQALAATIEIATTMIDPHVPKAAIQTALKDRIGTGIAQADQKDQKDRTGIVIAQTDQSAQTAIVRTEIGIAIATAQMATATVQTVIEKDPAIEKDPNRKNPIAEAAEAVAMEVHDVADLVVAVAETADAQAVAAVVVVAQVVVVVAQAGAVATETVTTATIAGATIIGIAIVSPSKSMTRNWSKASACWSFIQTDTASFAAQRKITLVTVAIRSCPAR